MSRVWSSPYVFFECVSQFCLFFGGGIDEWVFIAATVSDEGQQFVMQISGYGYH